MKPFPKIRKCTKWTGLVLCIVLLAALIASGVRGVVLGRPDGLAASVVSGIIQINVPAVNKNVTSLAPIDNTAHWYFYKYEWSLSWGFGLRSVGGLWDLDIPLWFPLLLLLIPTAFAWWRDTLAAARLRLNLCPQCNYDRGGLDLGASCPECNTVPSHPK